MNQLDNTILDEMYLYVIDKLFAEPVHSADVVDQIVSGYFTKRARHKNYKDNAFAKGQEMKKTYHREVDELFQRIFLASREDCLSKKDKSLALKELEPLLI